MDSGRAPLNGRVFLRAPDFLLTPQPCPAPPQPASYSPGRSDMVTWPHWMLGPDPGWARILLGQMGRPLPPPRSCQPRPWGPGHRPLLSGPTAAAPAGGWTGLGRDSHLRQEQQRLGKEVCSLSAARWQWGLVESPRGEYRCHTNRISESPWGCMTSHPWAQRRRGGHPPEAKEDLPLNPDGAGVALPCPRHVRDPAHARHPAGTGARPGLPNL